MQLLPLLLWTGQRQVRERELRKNDVTHEEEKGGEQTETTEKGDERKEAVGSTE